MRPSQQCRAGRAPSQAAPGGHRQRNQPMKKRIAPSSRTAKLPAKLPTSSAVQPLPQSGALESVDPAKREALISEALGLATGVGPNKPIAEVLLAQFHSTLGAEDIFTSLLMLTQLHPQSILETLLVTQMIGVHQAALRSLRASMTALSEESSDQYASQATRFMRLFDEQTELL